MAIAAAVVNFTTTDARSVSYKTTKKTCHQGQHGEFFWLNTYSSQKIQRILCIQSASNLKIQSKLLTFTTVDKSKTCLRTGYLSCSTNEVIIAIGYASSAKGTGILLINIGTKIPPPVQANMKETNL